MAKSIFEILDSLETETSVPALGKNVDHTLPRKLFPDSATFEDGEKLLAWSNEQGYTHALIQMGLQKGLIDCRATFKSCKKDDVWSSEYGQANVDKMTWTITERPKASAAKITTVESALAVLSQLSPEALAKALADMQANK